jgi:hypothetical protein
MRDISHIEKVESELDAFIGKRDRQRREKEGERLEEQLYKQACRDQNGQRELSYLFQWRDFYGAQLEAHRRNFRLLLARNKANLERVEREIERRSA